MTYSNTDVQKAFNYINEQIRHFDSHPNYLLYSDDINTETTFNLNVGFSDPSYAITWTEVETYIVAALAAYDYINLPLTNVEMKDHFTALDNDVADLKDRVFPIFRSVSVASGVAVFHLTDDGLSTGDALFTTGPEMDSVQPIINDPLASYQFGWEWSNSDKTLTVTVNAPDDTVCKLTVFGK